jgi:hypothetical protein
LDELYVSLIVARLSWLSCPGSVTFLNKLGWLTVAWLSISSCLDTILDELSRLTEAGLGGLACVTFLGVSTDDRSSALTDLTFSYVDLRGSVVGRRTLDSVEVSVVGSILDVDLSSDVALVWFLVSLSADLNLGDTVLGIAAVLLVDADLFSALFSLNWTTDAVLFVDTNLLFVLSVGAFAWDGLGEGSEASFVTFPSDVRSLRR